MLPVTEKSLQPESISMPVFGPQMLLPEAVLIADLRDNELGIVTV